MLKILLVCAFVSIIVDTATAAPEDRGHAWFEGAAILLAVAVVSLVGAGSDYKKEIQFVKNAQISEKDNTIFVKRRGAEEEINFNFL